MKKIWILGLFGALWACDDDNIFDDYVTDVTEGPAYDESSTDGDGKIGLKVECQDGSDRVTILVGANNLRAGEYSARVESGDNQVDAEDSAQTVDGEVEFDFDSASAGATEIDVDFIQDGQITGVILDSDGEVVASRQVDCDD